MEPRVARRERLQALKGAADEVKAKTPADERLQSMRARASAVNAVRQRGLGASGTARITEDPTGSPELRLASPELQDFRL